MEQFRGHVVVHGFVQGVWFRQSTKDEAMRLGVSGWVRNLPNGDVEAVFEGEKKKVEEIVAWCHRGPAGAQVTSVNVTWERYRGDFARFDIRYGR
jgi:acylphosphatase